MATTANKILPATGAQKTIHAPTLTVVEGGTPPSAKTMLNLAEHGWAAFHFEDDAKAQSFYKQYPIEPFLLYKDSEECFYIVQDSGQDGVVDGYTLFRGDIYLPAYAPENIELDGSLDDVKPIPEGLIKTPSSFPTCTATAVYAPEGVRLTKQFTIDESGTLIKTSAPQLSGGVAQTVTFPLDQLLELASNPSECLVLGAIKGQKPNSKPAPLTTTDRLAQVHEGDARAITRTKDSFTFPSDQACYAFIDHDPDEGTIPPIKSLCLEELIERITSAWPDCGLGTSALIYTPSSTAGVRRLSDPARDTSDAYQGSAHISLAFAPGVDPEAWMRTLYAKLIEAGHGSAYITKMGRINVRTLIDQVVAQPCRVEYTAPAVLAKGVVRDELKRPEDVWQRHGGYVEVSAAALYTEEQVKRIVETERKRLSGMPEVKERVEATLERVRQDAEAKYRATGTAPGDAERQAQDLVRRLREGGDKITLRADDPIDLILDDGTAVLVGAIHADMQAGGEQYHERGCADPDSGQSGKAKIYYQANKQQVWIHSFAGGGRNYVVVVGESEHEAKIRQLAALPPFEYERLRKAEAAAMNVRTIVLDDEVRRCRTQQNQDMNQDQGIADWVAELNEGYAVVNAHGKTFVVSQFYDAQVKRDTLEFQTCRAFSELYASDYVTVTDEDGDLAEVSKGTWTTAPGRKTYHRLVYAPTQPPHEYRDGATLVMNQWTGLGRGLPASSEGGTAEPMLRHIKERMADGNDEYAGYITRWLAYKIQNPGSRPEVALVLRGKKGAGKGTLGHLIRRLFGRHGLHIASADMLTGSFNGHLADVSFLLADEAFFPGDKSNLGRLNVLVTDETFMIHPKGMTPYQGFNTLGIMMLSNEHWVVPATEDERRYAVFDVREKAQDGSDDAYFDALKHWCDEENNPLAGANIRAFVGHMQQMDLNGWHPRAHIPQTEALAAQREHTLEPVEQFWLNALREGEFSPGHGWCPLVKMQYLYQLFELHCRKHNVGQYHRLTQRQFSQRTIDKLGLKARRATIGEEWFDHISLLSGGKVACLTGRREPPGKFDVRGAVKAQIDAELGRFDEPLKTVSYQQVKVYPLGSLDEARQHFVKVFKVSPASVGLGMDETEDDDDLPESA